MRLSLLVALVGTVSVASAFAQTPATPLAQRNALMKSIWSDAWGPMTRMYRGEQPYDQATVDAAFAKLNEIARKLPPLWPAKSSGVAPKAGYTSTTKVWQNKADFDAKLAAFTRTVAANTGTVKTLDEMKVAYDAVNKTCDDCHEPYRARARR